MSEPEDHQSRVFCAALQGYLMSMAGSHKLPNPANAVAYARKIVREAYNHDKNRTLPDYTGPDEKMSGNQ